MEVRKLARPELVAVVLTLATVGGVAGYIATRDDDSEEFIPDPSLIDAAIDSTPIDAPPDSAIDAPASTEWTMVTIDGPEATIGLDGADGLDLATIDGNYVLISAFEQSGSIRVITRAGTTSGAWSAITLSTVVNVEDAKWCDIDSDGRLDVVAGGQGKRILVWWGVPIDANTFTAEADDDTLTSTAHGWSTGDALRVSNSGGALPTGVVAATNYYVIRLTANTFKLATTFANALAGTAINLTTDGTGTQTATSTIAQSWLSSTTIDAATNLQQWLQLDCTTSGGKRLWASGRGTANQTFTAEADDDTLTRTAHGYTTGDVLRVSNSGGGLPTGLAVNTVYYAIRTGANTLELATSRADAFAGTQIDLTTDGTGTQTMTRQAMLGYFTPGVDARDGSLFTWTPIAPVMWAMSVEAADYDGDGDLDVALSDRQNGGSGLTIGNKGTTWFEDTAGVWSRNTIYFSNNEGDPKFLEIVGANTVMMGVSSDSNANKLYKSVTADSWSTWTTTEITPYPTSTGQYQGVTTCDLNLDSTDDYVLTHAVATGTLSGTVAYDGDDASRIDIDLSAGEKYDNALCLDYDGDTDLDVWTTEQNIGLGVVVFINPHCPGGAGC